MVIVNFYGKPGCIHNARQKALLHASGHHVIARNLLIEPWTPARLYPFFEGLAVERWFNTTASPITNGLLATNQLDADLALDLMVLDPDLIRRPLLQVGHQRQVGFEPDIIHRWIGLSTTVLGETELSPAHPPLGPKATARWRVTGGASLA